MDIPKNEPALLSELAGYIDSYLRENCFLRDDCDNFIQATMEIICEVKKTSKRGQEEINKKFHEEKKQSESIGYEYFGEGTPYTF